MASNGTAGRAPRVLDHVTAPYRGRGQFVGIVVAVGRGTVDVHFLDGDFAAGVDAAAVSLYTGRRPRASAGSPIAVRMALVNEPSTPLVVVAYDDAYAVVSGPEGNRAYPRDMLRAFDPNGDSSDDEAPASQLVQGETVMVGRTGHVATVERAPHAGDDKVLLRWESTRACEEVALSEVEKLSAGRSSRRSAPRAPVATPRPSPRPARPAVPQRPRQAPPVPRATPSPTPEAADSSDDDASSVLALRPYQPLADDTATGKTDSPLDLISDSDDEPPAPKRPRNHESTADEIPRSLRDHLKGGPNDQAPALMPRDDSDDDGEAPAPPVRSRQIVVGDDVWARFGGGNDFFAATIAAVRSDNTYDLVYRDGEGESRVAAPLVLAVGLTFKVRFRSSGEHRGTVTAIDRLDCVTVAWRPVLPKPGEGAVVEYEEYSFDEVRTEVIERATPELRGPVAPAPVPEKKSKGTRAARKLFDPRVALKPANPRTRKPVFKEFFAGTKRLSTELKTTYGCACETVDDGSWPGAARPSRRCCVLDYPVKDMGWVDGALFAFPCRTFNILAIAHHQPLVVRGRRVLEGSSISPEARKANAVVRHCIALMRAARRVNPQCVLMAENPATGFLQHFEPWKDAVREFGLERRDITYCTFGEPIRKLTSFWSDIPELHRDAADDRLCCSAEKPCQHFGAHEPVQGEVASAASAYPQRVAYWLARLANGEMEARGARRH